ncbi:hypothetical protein BD410DRAFT_786644 [Rickenella mellea]|uniref:SH3 domain-containing protein n=1 Tax=Rickenella mellea TaxID=50990 RepID=A0A4Y7Q9B6_9AGAM|nr:hypothetical protein BD410DRAFT_786644 [Rickenella mellea]
MSECPVCFEVFGPDVTPVALPCGHILCESDVDTVSNQCPTCRREFSPGNAIKLFMTFDATPKVSAAKRRSSGEQQEKIRRLSVLLRDLNRDSSVEEIQRIISSVHRWTRSVVNAKHPEITKVLEQFNLLLELLSSQLAESAQVKDMLDELRERRSVLRVALDEMTKRRDDVVSEFTSQFELMDIEFKKQLAEIQSQNECLKRELVTIVQNRQQISQLAPSFRDLNPRRSLAVSLIPPQTKGAVKARARWSHNLNGEVAEDLTFKEGELIRLVHKPRGIWWIGMTDGRIGCIPDSCIDTYRGRHEDNSVWAIARTSHNIHREVEEDLTFCRGNEIKIIDKLMGVWWFGILGGRLGCIPNEKVMVLEHLRRSITV